MTSVNPTVQPHNPPMTSLKENVHGENAADLTAEHEAEVCLLPRNSPPLMSAIRPCAVQGNIVPGSIEEIAPDASSPLLEEDAQAQDLVRQVKQLWSEQSERVNTAKLNSKQLKEIRTRLGEQLSALKRHLARPGCKGDWSAYLRQIGISRTSADRHVAKYEHSTASLNENCTTGAIPLPQAEVSKLVTRFAGRVRKNLPHADNVTQFLDELIASLSPAFEHGGL